MFFLSMITRKSESSLPAAKKATKGPRSPLLLFEAGSIAPSIGPQATAEQIVALHVAAAWTDDVVDSLQCGGANKGWGSMAREIKVIQGKLARIDRVKRKNETANTGVALREADEIADRLAQVWLDLSAHRARARATRGASSKQEHGQRLHTAGER